LTTTPEKSVIVQGKPSAIGKSIEAKAIESKLTDNFSHVAEYTPITIREQSERAAKIVNDSLDEARSMIRGEVALPDNLRGTSLITAMEEVIKVAEPKVASELAYELANSPLVSETSAAAQELRLAAEREPDSATAKLREIRIARQTKAKLKDEAKAKAKLKSEAKTETEKINLSKEELGWDNFLREITC
jgi:hypothetical protein